jgi:hypothetical protein
MYRQYIIASLTQIHHLLATLEYHSRWVALAW